MIYPKVEDLLDRVDSKFSLVTLAAYRARQINSYFNQLGEGLGHSIPPQVSSVARKPLSIAFEEIAADKIVKIDRLPYEEMEQEAAEIFGELPSDVADDVSAETSDEVAEAESDEVAEPMSEEPDVADAEVVDSDES